MVSITACVITKNESETINLWLASMQRLTEDLVVVDTGSGDNTVEIAAAGGAHVYSFPWQNDFAAAKNFAIDQARGEWIVFLDADEYFSPEAAEQLSAYIEKYHTDRDVDALVCKIINIDADDNNRIISTFYNLRIFRNISSLRYARPVHEVLENRDGMLYKCVLPDEIAIYHTGYSSGRIKKKWERNLKILLAEIDRVGELSYHYRYLCECYYGMGLFPLAEKYARLHMTKGERAIGNDSTIQKRLIECMMMERQDKGLILAEIDRFIAEFPDDPEFLWHKGELLFSYGDYPAAEQAFLLLIRRAASLKSSCDQSMLQPRISLAYYPLGRIAESKGDTITAIRYYQQSLRGFKYNDVTLPRLLALLSEYPLRDGVAVLGGLYDGSDIDRAFIVKCFAERTDSDLYKHYTKDSAERLLSPVADAKEGYEDKALIIEELKEKATQFVQRAQYRKAIFIGKQICRLDMQSLEGLHIMALCHMQLGEYDAAIKWVEEIWAIDPQYMGAHLVLAHVHKRCNRLAEEINVLEGIVAHFENVQGDGLSRQELRVYSEARSMLGSAYVMLGETEKAEQCFLLSSRLEASEEQKIVEYSNYLFTLNYDDCLSDEAIYQAHLRYNDFFLSVDRLTHTERDIQGKIRVGYISPDFRRHAVVFFSYALLAHFNRDKFTVMVYSLGGEDIVSEQLKQLVDTWRDLRGLSAETAAKLIYDDRIDILVDLSGHTANNALPILARKPAPIQVSGIGYFNTTGLAAVDYFLTDSYCDPPGMNDAYFCETLLRLPYSHFAYAPLLEMPPCADAPCLINGYITFGSFNNFNKVTDRTLVVWGKILARIPTAQLMVKSKIFGSEYGRNQAAERLREAGIALERVIFRPFSAGYLAEYHELDIALDTFPYPGGATTCEALYMGVPVISLIGERHGARFGFSLLKNCGLEELAAADEMEYIEKAVLLAENQSLVQDLHKKLRSIMQGSVLMDMELYTKSVESAYRCMIQRCPIITYTDIQETLQEIEVKLAQGDFASIISLAESALPIDPNHYGLLTKLAGAYIECKKTESAQQVVQHLYALMPEDLLTNYLQARIFYDQGKFIQAIALLNAMVTNEECGESEIKSLICNLLANLYGMLGDCSRSTSYYLLASELSVGVISKAVDYSNYLFHLNYLPDLPQVDLYQAHQGYQALFAGVKPYVHTGISARKGKMRIGYISPDFREHVVTFFTYVLFTKYDKARFSVICFSSGKEDYISETIKQAVDEWVDIRGISAQAAAQCIYDHQIDILVDLSGHTKNNCLPILALKPAPIQISGIGYFNTTGLTTVDYFLTDGYCDPVGENDAYFTEKLLRLPHSHFCYTPLHRYPARSTGLPYLKNQYITFGSFNNFAKVNDRVLNVWREILSRVPRSQLVLKSSIFFNDDGLHIIKERMRQLGLPMERIEFRAETRAYLEEYNAIDIALDTFPYPGGGTTCDALYMGVPVVSLVGERHGSRFGFSILSNLGIAELAADTEDAYIAIAVALAADIELLNAFRQNLRTIMQSSALMNVHQYMEDMETAYRTIWEKLI